MLYVLRHCERDIDNPYFDSPLLPEGLDKAQHKVKNELLKYNIDKIYCFFYPAFNAHIINITNFLLCILIVF